jgi:hypothetical protein
LLNRIVRGGAASRMGGEVDALARLVGGVFARDSPEPE